MSTVTLERSEPMPEQSAERKSPLADSARRLHRTALQAFRLGNRGRFGLGQCLRALQESRQYLELGAPSIEAYSKAHFRMARSATYEAIRVAKALDELRSIREAFLSGALDWSSVRELTRIAKPDTEAEWVKFAREHTTAEVAAEVRDAEANHRRRPRNRDGGLPNLDRNLVVRLRASEHERMMRGLERIAPAVSERLGGAPVDTKQVLLFLAEWLLETEPAELLAQRRPRVDPSSAVIYRRCSGCRRGDIHTQQGWVQVQSEELDRVEQRAWVEPTATTGAPAPRTIDSPTTPALRRKVLLRDGGRCANPSCSHRADHAHHIVFRSRGGQTTLENEIAVCATCHALIHAGLLHVRGTGGESLEWRLPASAVDAFGSLQKEAQAAPLPEIRVVLGAPATFSSDHAAAATDSATGSASNSAGSAGHQALESASAGWLRRHGPGLESGLVHLGVPKDRARSAIRAAVDSMPHGWSEVEVLRRALIAYRSGARSR